MLVGGALLVVCGVALGVSEALTHSRTQTEVVARHIDRVIVHAGTGHVHLEGTEAPRVMVKEELRWMWKEPRVATRVDGSTITVSASCPESGSLNRCKADLDLAIPFDADVVVTGDSGDITAERLAGHVDLNTDSGDVRADRLNPISVRARTNVGNVDLG